MTQLLLIAPALLLLTPGFFPQAPEYGKPSDLKGVRRVFIDTGAEAKARERIAAAIEKAKLGVEVIGSPEGAELILQFSPKRVSPVRDAQVFPPLVPNMPSRTRIVYQNPDSGSGSAYVPLAGGGSRILYNWSGGDAAKFVGHFIKEYKKANGIK